MFENYNETKMAILVLEKLIIDRKEELSLPITSHLTGMPKAKNIESKVEKTIIRYEDDERLQELERKLLKRNKEIEMADYLLKYIKPRERETIEQKYIEGYTWDEVADAMNEDPRTLQRRTKKTFDSINKIISIQSF
jgi:DNA-directed RNA polymerase specialized sigma24 family protein